MFEVKVDPPRLREVIEQRNSIFKDKTVTTTAGDTVNAFAAATMIEAIQNLQYVHKSILVSLAKLKAGDDIEPVIDMAYERRVLDAIIINWPNHAFLEGLKMSEQGVAFFKEVFPDFVPERDSLGRIDFNNLGEQLNRIERDVRTVVEFPKRLEA